eukprot:comp23707_c0_seq1/m.40773 comp23707_c0_seq1/g.40773  ORF comp23707_c0_seq1/g.40773 comp23707_c0_seq1/m.40773 type:complete len:971 (-) comp23707_c0_seq1:522-3434(-)
MESARMVETKDIVEELLAQARTAKDEGNEFFKNGEFEKAAAAYTKALGLCPEGNTEAAVCLKNRAACYLKLKEFTKTVDDCTAALKLAPSDVKTLFRRGQALEELGRLDDAFTDIRTLLSIEPQNKTAQTAAARIAEARRKRDAEGNPAGDDAATTMLSILDGRLPDTLAKGRPGGKPTPEMVTKALRNIASICSNPRHAENLVSSHAVQKLLPYLEGTGYGLDAEHREDQHGAVLVALGDLVANQKLAPRVMDQIGWERLSVWLSSKDTTLRHGAVRIVSRALHSSLEANGAGANKDSATHSVKIEEITDEKADAINLQDRLLDLIVEKLNDCAKNATEQADAVVDDLLGALLINVSPVLLACFMQRNGITSLLNCAARSGAFGSAADSNMKLRIAVALSKFADAATEESQQEKLKRICVEYVRDGLGSGNSAEELRALNVMSTVLQASNKIGGWLAEQEGIVRLLIDCCESTNPAVQGAAAEVISHAASDRARCTMIVAEGATQLHSLYLCHNDQVVVRALVGLSKIATVSGSAKDQEMLGAGALERLYDASRDYLVEVPDKSLQKWAVEAIAYQSINGDIKEKLCADRPAVKAILEVGTKTEDKALAYAVLSIIQNITCSQEKKELDEEQEQLKKLKEYAKEYIPEDHPKDTPEYVAKRVAVLVEEGVSASLVHLAKSTEDSEKSMAMIGRILLTIADNQKFRGRLVADGAHLTLLKIANKLDLEAGIPAAQALAKIAITTDPNVAFKGEKALELVRPLVKLLSATHELRIFEGLMALTNLTSMGDAVFRRMIACDGVHKVCDLQTDDNPMIQRAATECMCNMLSCPEVFEMYTTQGTPRYEDLKLWILLADSDDVACAKAAGGGLAILSQDESICKRIVAEKVGLEVVKRMILSPDSDLQLRGAYVLCNILECDQDGARKFVEKEEASVESLSYVAREAKTRPDVRQKVEECLRILEEYGMIKKAI